MRKQFCIHSPSWLFHWYILNGYSPKEFFFWFTCFPLFLYITPHLWTCLIWSVLCLIVFLIDADSSAPIPLKFSYDQGQIGVQGRGRVRELRAGIDMQGAELSDLRWRPVLIALLVFDIRRDLGFQSQVCTPNPVFISFHVA